MFVGKGLATIRIFSVHHFCSNMASRSTIALKTSLLSLISLLSCSAAPPTYQSCLLEAHSVVINDWCFALLMTGIPYANVFAAEQVCQPNGHVAAPITKQMQTALQTMTNNAKLNITNLHSVWISMMQKFNLTNVGTAIGMKENWFWKIRDANNNYVSMAMIPNELHWAGSDPSEFNYVEYGQENFGIIVANYGVGDVAVNGGGSAMNRGVICQFKAPSRVFVRYNVPGIFNIAGYMVNQASVTKAHLCSTLCSMNEFCQSFAYADGTSDCQNYAVTPLDPAKTPQVVPNSNYVMYVRQAVS